MKIKHTYTEGNSGLIAYSKFWFRYFGDISEVHLLSEEECRTVINGTLKPQIDLTKFVSN